jgi:uncharacterized protein (TIRG00374 family)
MVLYSDASAVGEAVTRLDPAWLPVILGLPLLNYLLRFLKWQYFLGRVDVSVPWRRSLEVFISGFSMTVSPGKFGELLKCYLLRSGEGIEVSRTSPVVVAERITDLISMVVIALIGAAFLGGRAGLLAAAAGTAFVGIVMVVLLSQRAFGCTTDLLCRFRFFRSRREAICRFQDHCSDLLDARSLAVTVPLGILSWGAEALVLCAVARSLGYTVGAGLALLAHAAGTIAGAVSMIPGGLGLTEITIDGLLTDTLPVSTATAVTLLMRFATLWFAVILGVAALGLQRRKD